MSLRLRLLLLMLAIYCAGGYFLTRWTLNQVRPRYLESMEESLVDFSVLLASAVEIPSPVEGPNVANLKAAFDRAEQRRFEAKIFSLRKTGIDLRVYVTDAKGLVVFDSTSRNEGRDFSHWNDVARTLAGHYGARSTRDVPGDDNTQVLYVAAPVRRDGRIVGVVSVGKPAREINELVAAARRKIVVGAVGGGVTLLGGLLLVAAWAIAPLERLTAYARAVRDGKPASPPALPGRTLRDLGNAFEEMRDTLAGRRHAERYTQALAHEVKAPLSAIRGAAELLGEEMSAGQRQKFLENIRGESARIERIVDRLLELTSLEARKALGPTEKVGAAELAADAAEAVRAAYRAEGVVLKVAGGPVGWMVGERFLLRQALVNLLQNALDFSPAGSEVTLRSTIENGRVVFAVEDRGPGVPDYALPRIFERFYSLARPGTSRKSTGIGLALVREIAHLHEGDAALENRPDGGARATFWIPGESR